MDNENRLPVSNDPTAAKIFMPVHTWNEIPSGNRSAVVVNKSCWVRVVLIEGKPFQIFLMDRPIRPVLPEA